MTGGNTAVRNLYLVSLQCPTDDDGHITLGDNARHVSKITFIKNVFAKVEWKYFWRFCNIKAEKILPLCIQKKVVSNS